MGTCRIYGGKDIYVDTIGMKYIAPWYVQGQVTELFRARKL